MTLAQWTLDAGLRLRGAGAVRRLEFETVTAARKTQLRPHDPLVAHQIGQVALQLPLSHQLPYYRRTFPQCSSNIGRIGAKVQQKYPGSTAYLPLLLRNVDHLGDVEIEAAFIGGTSGPVARSVPMADGTAHLATGGLDQGTISLRRLDEIILRHPRFETSKLVKSDTDGMDCQIIAGAADYLATARPAVFFEYAPRPHRASRRPRRSGSLMCWSQLATDMHSCTRTLVT